MIADGVKQAGPIGPLNEANLLEFNSFQKVHSVIQQLTISVIEQKTGAYKAERR